MQIPVLSFASNCNHPNRKYSKERHCAPPFGYQTTVPKELEFPQESHTGSRKRLKFGVSKKGDR